MKTRTLVVLALLVCLVSMSTGCKSVLQRQDVRPLVLRDVPANRLAYRLDADVGPPRNKDSEDKLAPVQADFNSRRQNDVLLRTVSSPDNQRALALYNTEDEPSVNFRIDLYAADGKFLRNLTPPTLSCVFPEAVAWSPDGNSLTFIAHKKTAPSPTPTPPGPIAPVEEASPSPSIGPAFPSVPVFATEQIYVCNRDGLDLRPLTTREGLIYFYFAWAPDNHALVALACKEDEWDSRERQHMLPAGRPRLILPDGSERLLDDRLTQALPVWSPDASKVATGFESDRELDVSIYDAATNRPTQARVPLRNAMIRASIAYEQKTSKTDSAQPVSETSDSAPPPSYNPIVILDWISPDKLYFQTAYIRLMKNETINTFPRWHMLLLSPQAAVLK
jgi:hypothetical protein